MKYRIKDLKNELNPIAFTEYTIELLNEVHDPLTIGILTYQAGDALYSIDPVAFRQVMAEQINSLCEDDTIISFDNGDTYYWMEEVEEYEIEEEEEGEDE
jgi:hypothetical protein